MHAYRFKMLLDDQEDFLRDFEILSSQTFLDFHNLIRESVELQGNELASFFVCDPNWRKKREITLINMQDDFEDDDEDEDSRAPKKNKIPVYEMDKVKIKDIIDDPHQRLLYEYNFLDPKIFFVELTKIVDADKAQTYPVCIKSTGKLAMSVPLPVIPDEDDEDIALFNEFDDIQYNSDDDPDMIIFEPEP